MTRWPQQPPTRVRSFAAWVGLLLLIGVGHVVPALHFLFVAHRLCAEHGELLDVAAESPEPVREKGSASFYRAGAAAHSHEHCGVLAVARASGAPAALPGLVQVLSRASVASAPGEEGAAHVDIALLDYAPKLAPPRPLAALPPLV